MFQFHRFFIESLIFWMNYENVSLSAGGRVLMSYSTLVNKENSPVF